MGDSVSLKIRSDLYCHANNTNPNISHLPQSLKSNVHLPPLSAAPVLAQNNTYQQSSSCAIPNQQTLVSQNPFGSDSISPPKQGVCNNNFNSFGPPPVTLNLGENTYPQKYQYNNNPNFKYSNSSGCGAAVNSNLYQKIGNPGFSCGSRGFHSSPYLQNQNGNIQNSGVGSTMPPVEAMQLPKDPSHSPSTPTTPITSSIICSNTTSGNLESLSTTMAMSKFNLGMEESIKVNHVSQPMMLRSPPHLHYSQAFTPSNLYENGNSEMKSDFFNNSNQTNNHEDFHPIEDNADSSKLFTPTNLDNNPSYQEKTISKSLPSSNQSEPSCRRGEPDMVSHSNFDDGTQDMQKIANYYKNLIPSVDVGLVPSNDISVNLQRRVIRENEKIEKDSGDIIDVVSIKDSSITAGQNKITYSVPNEIQRSTTMSNEKFNVEEKSKDIPKSLDNVNVSENIPISQTETLDLSTRTKDIPSNKNIDSVSPPSSLFLPTSRPTNFHPFIQKSHLQENFNAEDSKHRKNSSEVSGTDSLQHQRKVMSPDDFKVISNTQGSPGGPDSPINVPPSNLPPHILAWLLSSHMNPMVQRSQMSHILPPPTPPLLNLGSFYIPSPEPSPDELMEQKPLDLSSKSPQSESSLGWFQPIDSRNKESFLSKITSSLQKPNSPVSAPRSPMDDTSGASFLKQLSPSSQRLAVGSGMGLSCPSSLSTEDLIARVLEAKATGRGRRRTDQSKRNYTDTELQAALRDIQSGKLGTRRAAVVYGVPRSTLRNKVYKMSIEKERARKILEQAACDPSNLFSTIADDAAFTSSDTLRALLKNKMAVKVDEISKVNSPTSTNYEEEEELERRQAQDPALEHLIDNVASLAFNHDHREMRHVMSSLCLYPQLEEVARKLIEKRYNEEITKSKEEKTLNDPLLSIRDLYGLHNRNPEASRESKINVPFFDQVNSAATRQDNKVDMTTEASHHHQQDTLQGFNSVNFKDMIAHYIGQKTRQFKDQEEVIGLPNKHNPNMVNSIAAQNLTNPVPKEKAPRGKKRTGSPLNSNGGGKGSRPKRGKYRNYDRENLIKAVQAVQSGEMSVHRAGSFYGVPHSTLEYKVKERHLNRGRSKKDSNAQNQANGSKPPMAPLPSRPTMVPTESFMETINDLRIGNQESRTIDLTDEGQGMLDSTGEPQPKARKIELGETDAERVTSPSNITQRNPFNLWESAPRPGIPSFLASAYEQHDSFYASQMIRRFQEAATMNPFTKDFHSSKVAPGHQSVDVEFEGNSSARGQSSGSCSPNFDKEQIGLDREALANRNSVLDALLRRKSPLEATTAAVHPFDGKTSPHTSPELMGENPWSVSSRLISLSKQLANTDEENKADQGVSPQSTESAIGFRPLHPVTSVFNMQTSIAASLNRQECQPVQHDEEILQLKDEPSEENRLPSSTDELEAPKNIKQEQPAKVV